MTADFYVGRRWEMCVCMCVCVLIPRIYIGL